MYAEKMCMSIPIAGSVKPSVIKSQVELKCPMQISNFCNQDVRAHRMGCKRDFSHRFTTAKMTKR